MLCDGIPLTKGHQCWALLFSLLFTWKRCSMNSVVAVDLKNDDTHETSSWWFVSWLALISNSAGCMLWPKFKFTWLIYPVAINKDANKACKTHTLRKCIRRWTRMFFFQCISRDWWCKHHCIRWWLHFVSKSWIVIVGWFSTKCQIFSKAWLNHRLRWIKNILIQITQIKHHTAWH